ncbi:LysM peptidoglycan-binding domain-containing protein [Cognatishimia sp. F0-27]|uniref:LysM peptidoglycan-binding domain-containing protein n=1 Tax=Cognatishimia sp. F0-27 TaxID=2816855 RepID=UPI001D0CC0E5|nr:LysM peptidoglycan-binding domain-containing protein [Cognatishimia sp. F0-27]MCC1493030.1 LysM peptidoglycan-binding domain-containing protein [Cognatishimia sp. F0-27]
MTARHSDTRLPFETPPTRRKRSPALFLSLIGLLTGFGAVYWSLEHGSTLDEGDMAADLVARGVQMPLTVATPEPAALPELARAVPVAPAAPERRPAAPSQAVSVSLRPLARPEALFAPGSASVPETDLTPAPVSGARTAPIAPAPAAIAEDSAADSRSGFDLMRQMSFGIVGSDASGTQAPPPPEPNRLAAAPPAQPIPETIAAPEAPDNLYVVQDGDSLHGIAFKTYGSMVRYLDILEANADVITHPSDLRAGMVLTIPD